MSLPLEGIRVIAVSQYGAGPFATMHLADLGAEVIKVEDKHAGGDSGRYVTPYAKEEDSLFFQSFNRNKKSITLDLRTEEGKEILQRLTKVSDCIFNNLRGDQPKKLGLDYESLKSINPKVVCCSLSGYGSSGSKASEPSYDYIIQAYSGLQSITGDPGSSPTKAGISVIDFATGFAAAFAILAGLRQASRNGEGCDIDVSMYDVAMSMMNYLAIWHLNRDFTPQKMADSAHPTFVPSQNFQTKDGWLVVMCNKEEFWKRLCEGIDRSDLLDDVRYKGFEERYRNKDVLIPLLKNIFSGKTNEEWMTKLRGKVPCSPIQSFSEALSDPLLMEREMIWTINSHLFGELKQIGSPIKISSVSSPREPAPRLGEHTVEILTNLLGYSKDEVDRLRQSGAI